MQQRLRLTHFVLIISICITSCTSLLLDQPTDIDETLTSDITKIKHTSLLSIDEAKEYVFHNKNNRSVDTFEPYVVDGDTLLYVVNYEKGWQLISSDKRTENILAYSDEGQMDIYDTIKIF